MTLASSSSSDWYPRLSHSEKFPEESSLFQDHPRETIEPPQVILSLVLPGKTARHFRLFDSPKAVQKFLNETPRDRQHFFEVICAEWLQKPYFDIDQIAVDQRFEENVGALKVKLRGKALRVALAALIEKTSDQLATTAGQIREEITHQFKTIGIMPEELRWYASNSKIKKSYHLIIPGYYFEDREGGRRLYEWLKERLPEDMRHYIDGSMYSKTQNFRLLGSHKPVPEGEFQRVKQFVKAWMFNGETIRHPSLSSSQRLKESLITWVPEDAKPFPYFEVAETPEKFRLDSLDLPDDLIKAVDQVFFKTMGPNFRQYRVSGSFISYLRTGSSKCLICSPFKPANDEDHDAENPFLRVFYHDNKWWVYLYCHRAIVYVSDPMERKKLLAVFKIQTVKTKEQLTTWAGELTTSVGDQNDH